jgi:hypothetical protein
MFPTRTVLLTLGALVLFSPSLSAGASVWAEGYPKRDACGNILIKGKTTADCGSTLSNTGACNGGGMAVIWPAGENGGNVISIKFDVNADGTWGETTLSSTSLDPKVRYVVVVQVAETKNCCTCAAPITIATPPKVARQREDGDDDDDDED